VGLCFAVVFPFFSLWHFAALYLRDRSGDRPETFTHDWKCVNLEFGGFKFGGRGPPKNLGGNCFFPYLGPKSPSSLDRSPRNFGQWRAMGGASKVSWKIWVSLKKKMWGSQNSKFCVKF